MLRDTGYEDDMKLEEVARDIKNAREILETLEARTLAGVAAMLSKAADTLSRTADRLEKMAPQEWMGLEEAANYLGKSKHAFQKAVVQENVRRHYLTGRRPLFNRQELDEWLLSR